MKLPGDLVRMYREVHGWVGIISGLALFIAFYAGALTMFELPLQRWASAPVALSPPPSLEQTPALVERVLAAHPEAAKSYEITLAPDAARPARMSWTVRQPGDHAGEGEQFFASLGPDGSLEVVREGPSQVAQLIDILHQQVGLPFAHEISMPIMGAIALLYTVALVSGLVVLLPSLVSDLFALRIGRNVKRMWLDLHNVLGLFSLPFHIIMALTALVFAFHDQFYDAQGLVLGGEDPEPVEQIAAGPPAAVLNPAEIVRRLQQQAPGFEPQVLAYRQAAGGSRSLSVQGSDQRYGMRGATYGMAGVDPATGTITETDYMPGMQDGWSATVTSFFALHFGNFGGDAVRWAYFLLGLAGAMLFYTGNLLWVESRRRRERTSGAVEQTRATRILGALTVGVPLGCVSGISVTLAVARLLPGTSYGLHSAIYYAVFLALAGWALLRGAARSGGELPIVAAVATLCIPVASFAIGRSPVLLVDVTATVLAIALLLASRSARRRAVDGASDSVWSLSQGTDRRPA